MYIIILVILLIIVLFFELNKKQDEQYDNWNWQLFNNNSDKPWKNLEVSYNNPYPQDIPRPSNNDPNFPTYVLEIANEQKIKDVLNKMRDFNANNVNFTKMDFVHSARNDLYKINKETWHKRLDDFNVYNLYNHQGNFMELPLKKSCVNEVNNILTDFLNKFNKLMIDSGNNRYSIYKYKIHQLDKNKYSFILVLLQDDSLEGITIYIQVIKNNKQYIYPYFDIIGYYYTDKLLLPDGKREIGENKYYEINPLYRDRTGEINYNNVEEELIKNKQRKLDNTLKYQYTCYNKEQHNYNPLDVDPQNPNDKRDSLLYYTYNKENCNNQNDIFSRVKPVGNWQRDCISDFDCEIKGKDKCDKLYGVCL